MIFLIQLFKNNKYDNNIVSLHANEKTIKAENKNMLRMFELQIKAENKNAEVHFKNPFL